MARRAVDITCPEYSALIVVYGVLRCACVLSKCLKLKCVIYATGLGAPLPVGRLRVACVSRKSLFKGPCFCLLVVHHDYNSKEGHWWWREDSWRDGLLRGECDFTKFERKTPQEKIRAVLTTSNGPGACGNTF